MAVMDSVNEAASLLNDGINYMKANLPFVFVLVALYLFVQPVVANFMRTSPQSAVKKQDDDLRRVRLEQQVQARERAIAARAEREEKEAEEKKRKNEYARLKPKYDLKGGNRLGRDGEGNEPPPKKKNTRSARTTGRGGDYNPMQPGGGGGSYRPARRSVGGS